MGFQKILDQFQMFYDKFDHGQGVYSEERVKHRAEYHAFIRKTDFMSIDEYNNFNSNYAGKNLPQFIRFAPNPQLDGYYKLGLFGIICNPAAKWNGYLPTSNYFLYQLKRTIKFSTGAMSGAVFDFSIVGLIVGILSAILFFCFGILIRLPIAIILTLIQFCVVLFAAKKDNNSLSADQ
jgi:hypothetical protein